MILVSIGFKRRSRRIHQVRRWRTSHFEQINVGKVDGKVAVASCEDLIDAQGWGVVKVADTPILEGVRWVERDRGSDSVVHRDDGECRR